MRGWLVAGLAALTVQVWAQQAGTAPAPALRTGTRLVVVDVTVTDQHHHAIHGLKAEDFTLLENNATQTVKNFEEHQPAAEVKSAALPALGPGEFSNRTAVPEELGGPVNVLLIDRLNTPMDSQTRLRAQLLDYLKKAKPGTRMAIFGLNTQLVLLQGFTSDPRLLRAVVERKMNSRASPLLGAAEASGGVDASSHEALDELATSPGESGAGAAALKMTDALSILLDAQLNAEQQRDRARFTLDGLNSLARYLSSLPGRKNLVWFSGSFPLDILPDANLGQEVSSLDQNLHAEFATVGDVREEYRETVSLLSRAQVVVYPVDARGAVLLPDANVAGEGARGDKYLQPGPNGTSVRANDLTVSTEKIFNENETMRELAYETGGRAFLNHNDLAGTLAEALDDGSSYYSLAYTPSNGDWKGDFRKIEVKLRQKGYELSYRRGYYADDPNSPNRRSVPGPKTKLAVPSYGAMHLALMHAGPEPTEVLMTVDARPASLGTEDSAAPGNTMRDGLKGPYRRYALNVKTDAKTLEFKSSADGLHHTAAEVVTFVYDSDGTLVNGIGQTVAADLKPEVYDAVMRNGLPVRQEVSVPQKGQYFLRVVVHDLNSDRVGAVEFPVSAMQGLAPAGPEDAAAPHAAAGAVTAAAAGSAAPASPTTEQSPVRVTATTGAVLPPAQEAELYRLLGAVHENYEAYVHSVPNLYASEAALSSVSAHDQMDLGVARSTAQSIFRLRRTGGEASLVESREVKVIDQKPVAEGSHFEGPVLVYGVFNYATSFLSPEARPCYDYRVQTNQKLHGTKVTVIEYALRSPLPAGVPCPFVEQNSGRAYVDPETMQVVRLEQKRPRHVLDLTNGAGMVRAEKPESREINGADLPTRDIATAVAIAGPMGGAVTVPPGTRVNWSWAVDYAPVMLDNQSFWLPRAVSSSTTTLSGRTIIWSFEAKYTNYHLLEVKSRVLGANGETLPQ